MSHSVAPAKGLGRSGPNSGVIPHDGHRISGSFGSAHSGHGTSVAAGGGGVRYEGRKLLPDVDEACEEVAGAITPRVGGVGPTTIAMLFRNLVEIAERNAGTE